MAKWPYPCRWFSDSKWRPHVWPLQHQEVYGRNVCAETCMMETYLHNIYAAYIYLYIYIYIITYIYIYMYIDDQLMFIDFPINAFILWVGSPSRERLPNLGSTESLLGPPQAAPAPLCSSSWIQGGTITWSPMESVGIRREITTQYHERLCCRNPKERTVI